MKEFPKKIMDLLRQVASREETPTHGLWEDGHGNQLQDDADAAIAWIESAQTRLSDDTQSMGEAELIVKRAGGRLMTNAEGHELLCFYPEKLKNAVTDVLMRERITQAQKPLTEAERLDARKLKEEIEVLRLMSSEYNDWIRYDASGGSYASFITARIEKQHADAAMAAKDAA